MIYFISDLHLGLGDRAADKARERSLLKFLSHIKPHCERLFILGDLFDYWFEYRTVVQNQHIRTLAALADFVESGIAVEYLIGNHDFGHRHFFEEELGVKVHHGDVSVQMHGKSFLLAHGDCKELDSRKSQFIRSILRNPLALKVWTALHPTIGIGIAAAASRKSRIKSSTEPTMNEKEGLERFAREAIGEGYDYVVMGHIHVPLVQQLEHKGRSGLYVNTGDWLTHDTFAQFDGKTLHLCCLGDVF
ncbi:MAG: UDP-2,3-diacylglucosamine diphosphatase [Candidatus Kapabacteria bacterium]|jgi:UDP-2,3-diacylglucosamine hydrolase|nr:UDP-2,3-diacylglucosamine diphosphatase [Candidatus Kapabacteria bacterium]